MHTFFAVLLLLFVNLGFAADMISDNCARLLQNFHGAHGGYGALDFRFPSGNTASLVLGPFDLQTGKSLPDHTFIQSVNFKEIEGIKPENPVPLNRYYFTSYQISEDGYDLHLKGDESNPIVELVVQLYRPLSEHDNIRTLPIQNICYYSGPRQIALVCAMGGFNSRPLPARYATRSQTYSVVYKGQEAQDIIKVLPTNVVEQKAYRRATILSSALGHEVVVKEVTTLELRHLINGLKGLGLKSDHPIFQFFSQKVEE